MASIVKRNNRFLAQVKISGKGFASKTFDTKREANQWAMSKELELRTGSKVSQLDMTFADLIDRYAVEITPGKKSAISERSRINMLKDHFGKMKATKINKNVVRDFMDKRLKTVTNSSIQKDLCLISHVYTIARKLWDINVTNPCTDIIKPKKDPHRERRLNDGEYDLLINNAHPELRKYIIVAVETAMRRGEVGKITKDTFRKDYIYLSDTKNGKARSVPLTPLAQLTINQGMIEGRFLTYNLNWYSDQFNALCKKLNIENLRLHDLRHEGVSRLVERGLTVMQVCSISGHTNLEMMQRYTNLKVDDLVKQLSSST